jgi:hypothetical protein
LPAVAAAGFVSQPPHPAGSTGPAATANPAP